MARRKPVLLWAGLLVVLAGITLAGWRWAVVQPGPTSANFWRLRAGMTPQEVDAILGPPSSVETHGGALRFHNYGELKWDTPYISAVFPPPRYDALTDATLVLPAEGVHSVRLDQTPSLAGRLLRWLGL